MSTYAVFGEQPLHLSKYNVQNTIRCLHKCPAEIV